MIVKFYKSRYDRNKDVKDYFKLVDIHSLDVLNEKKKLIEELRKEKEISKNDKDYKELKSNFYGFESHNINSLIGEDFLSNGLMVFDVDKITQSDINRILRMNSHYYGSMISPSGNGVKLILKVNNITFENFKLVYKKIMNRLEKIFSVKFDEACNKHNILCYIGTDLVFYDDFEPINAEDLYKPIELKSLPVTSSVDGVEYVLGDVRNTEITEDDIRGFNNFLRLKKISWSKGERLRFYQIIPYYNIPLEKLVKLIIRYINNDWTSEHSEKKVLTYVCKRWTIAQKDLSDKLNEDCGLNEMSTKNFTSYKDTLQYVKKTVDKLTYTKYLSDNPAIIESLYQSILENITLLKAETGAGKTRLIYELVKKYNIKTDFILPTTVLTEQQNEFTKDYDLTVYKSGEKNKVKDSLITACVYNSLPNIQHRQSDLLIIDEAHMLVTEYNFRNTGCIDPIMEFIKNNRYKYILLLTATPEPIQAFIKGCNVITPQRSKPSSTLSTYSIYIKEPNEKTLSVIGKLTNNGLNVIYNDNKVALEKLKCSLEASGKKCILLNSELKKESNFIELIENQSIDDCDYVLTTRVIREGVNITKKYDYVNFIFFGADSVSIQQFIARFRNSKRNHITIIHSGRNEKYISVQLDDLSKLNNELERLSKVLASKGKYGYCTSILNQLESNKHLILGEDGKYEYSTMFKNSLKWNLFVLHQKRNLTALEDNLKFLTKGEGVYCPITLRNNTDEYMKRVNKKIQFIDKLVENPIQTAFEIDAYSDIIKVYKEIESYNITDKDIQKELLLMSERKLKHYLKNIDFKNNKQILKDDNLSIETDTIDMLVTNELMKLHKLLVNDKWFSLNQLEELRISNNITMMVKWSSIIGLNRSSKVFKDENRKSVKMFKYEKIKI